MKATHLLAFSISFCLFACQASTPSTVTILDNHKVITLQTDERVPSALITQAGITLNPNDRILANGLSVSLELPLTTYPITIQTRRAVTVTFVTPTGQQQIQSSAASVGDMLAEITYRLHVGDQVVPPLSSALENGMTITITSGQTLYISVDGRVLEIQSSGRTIGEALARAGIPLVGQDYSYPSENEALPSNGQIRVVRVHESILLTQKPIPFTSELVASADVPLDQNQILQPGENGLMMQRIRIRYEDGVEVARVTENETIVRPPKNRVLAYGTKIEIKTAVVDGVTIEYWRAVQMYATSYSPCRSGGDRCYSGTSSGKKLTKGMVALRYTWYLAMGGQALFIPGYGFATVEDVCGGCVGKPWIDLGYSDDDYMPWSSWVTVYFLTPVPASIIYVLN